MNGIIQVNLQQSSRGVMKFFIYICMYIFGGGGEGRCKARVIYELCLMRIESFLLPANEKTHNK